jgi:hypothetical protein
MLSDLSLSTILSSPSELIGPSPLVTKMIFRLYFNFLVNVLIIWMAMTNDEMAKFVLGFWNYQQRKNCNKPSPLSVWLGLISSRSLRKSGMSILETFQ